MERTSQERAELASANGSEIPMSMPHATHSGSPSNGGLPVGKSSYTGVIHQQRARQYAAQGRCLLLLMHAYHCTASEGQCNSFPKDCPKARELYTHLQSCRQRDCQYRRCKEGRQVLDHYSKCCDSSCPVCAFVKEVTRKKQAQSFHSLSGQGSSGTISSEAFSVTGMGNLVPSGTRHGLPSPVYVSLTVDLQPHSPERRKLECTTADACASPLAREETPTSEASSTMTSASMAKSGKSKVVGTSLIELFTPEMIREHIAGLRQWAEKSNANAKENQGMEHQISDSTCSLCTAETLIFEPLPIYCTSCRSRMKQNASYYTAAKAGHNFCKPCFKCMTKTVEMEGISYSKASLKKERNDKVAEESWVQCHKCKQWNHQICALFNSLKDEGGEAEYTCPECCLSEFERGERKPLQASAALGAKDLPRTFLSDFLEERLARKLKHERAERARAVEKSIDEVPWAEGLVIRVVSCVDKKIEVNQRFREIFQGKDYPREFPYKSKTVLLFQQIEGVEVCLFGMYVHEFGGECKPPNQRRVYLSYIDSVKYFRPDVKTINGEALRTYVYHEILIGYLDYCKRRGMTSCYIWASSPQGGDDYLFYSHPKIQKAQARNSSKLVEWYWTMLKKAGRDHIVKEVVNLYDYFFVSGGETTAKVTAASLPYFDGDYWPSVLEDMIVELEQEQNLQKKAKEKSAPTRRTHTSLAALAKGASNASKDLQLMYKLGTSISPHKENLIMLHMRHSCSHCLLFSTSGHWWRCKQCKGFRLCDRCYDVESKRDERNQHPITSKEAHAFTFFQEEELPQETQDKDKLIESEFFDNRQDFLSLCQGNRYQFDTLRRAKHSSMMILYHLHNPAVPAFVATCNVCSLDIARGAGWRCKTCPDFDMCNICKSLSKHQHKLRPHSCGSKPIMQNYV